MSDLELSDDILFNDDVAADEEVSSPSSPSQVAPVAYVPVAGQYAVNEPTTTDQLLSAATALPATATPSADIVQKPRWNKQQASHNIYAASAPVAIINPNRWRNTVEQAEKDDSSPVPSNTFVPLHNMYRSTKDEDILGTSYGEYRPRAVLRRKMEFLEKLGLIEREHPRPRAGLGTSTEAANTFPGQSQH